MAVGKRGKRKPEKKEKVKKLIYYSPNLASLLSGFFSKVEPPKADYSAVSYARSLDEYSLEAFDDFPEDEQPLIELELFNSSGYQFFMFFRDLGGGKTTVAQRAIRNYMLKLDKPALSFVHSRPMGEVQKEKFLDDSELLKDTLCRVITYFHGNKRENREIRESSLDHTFIITTPFMYAGSLTHFAPMISSDHLEFLKGLKDPEAWQDIFTTKGTDWAQALMSPSVVFIDEVDSFPQSTLYCLAVIVRLLIRKNPDLKVILASGTIPNPDDLAKLFFGPESEYLPIFGTGRQGHSTVDVFFEDKKHQLLRESIQAIKSYIREEIQPLDPENLPLDFHPDKCVIIINDKKEILIRENIGEFDDFFITLHGDMTPDEIADQMKAFRDNPLKICLVTTDIIHAGFDPANVVWGIFYGLPFSRRAFIQRRHRIIRNPKQKSHIDIILRSSNQDEQLLAESEDGLRNYVFQKERPPYLIPPYTPLILQYAIAFGLVFGYWDIMEILTSFIDNPYTHPCFLQDLQRAYLELLIDDIIAQAPRGMIRPTKQTKDWICNFPKRFDADLYNVVLKEKDGKEKILGRISFSRLQRYSLPGQTVPFIDGNYIVDKIDRENQIVCVTKGIQELYYYRNEISYSYNVIKILAHDLISGIKLVEILKEEYVSRVDRRTRIQDLDQFSAWKKYVALSIPSTLTSEVTEKISQVYHQLNLDSSLIKTQSTLDDQLGKGTLLIDTTKLNLAYLLYKYWIIHADNQDTGEKEEKESS